VRERVLDTAASLGPPELRAPERQPDVPGDAAREQDGALEDHRHRALGMRLDPAPLGPLETGETAEQRALPRTVRTENREHLAGAQLDRVDSA
jgi:hypothetical protein